MHCLCTCSPQSRGSCTVKPSSYADDFVHLLCSLHVIRVCSLVYTGHMLVWMALWLRARACGPYPVVCVRMSTLMQMHNTPYTPVWVAQTCNTTVTDAADLKAIWCGVIWRVNHTSTVDEAVQRFFPTFELLCTLLD